MFNFELIKKETEGSFPYFSSSVPRNALEREEVLVTLTAYAKEKNLFFYTYSLADGGGAMYALADDYEPEPSLTYIVLHDPTTPIK